MRKYLIVLIIHSHSVIASGQSKFEREFRIKPSEVPESALSFVDSLNPEKKVKWYFEENFKGNSIEAKVKYNGRKHSIEFDTTGSLQDIEILIDLENIPKGTKDSITTYLESKFSKFKISKVQLQYIGSFNTLITIVKKENTKDEFEKYYELIIKGKKENYKLYEITFDENGNWLRTSEIILRNTDILEY